MTTKLEQAAREVVRQHSMECLSDKAVDSLREALEPRPQNCGTGYCSCIECPYKTEQAEQEPVAWRCRYCKTDMPTEHASDCPIERFGLPNEYAAPVRTKDLTDDEIRAVWLKVIDPDGGDEVMALARAVIAADREKNK